MDDKMKMLYCASYVLSAPFWMVAWALFSAAWVFDWIGNFIHDKTTYKAWLVLHRKTCLRELPRPITEDDVIRAADKAYDLGRKHGHEEAAIPSRPNSEVDRDE
jgi:hypothetical protein